MKKENILSIAVAAAMLCFIVLLLVGLYPLVKEIMDNIGDETNIVNSIESYGTNGVPVLLGLEALQIIVAVIPQPAIDVLCGLCYGVLWGSLISITGAQLGNIIVFIAMRQLKNLFAPFIKKNDRRKKKFSPEMIRRVKRPELIVFFLVLLPVFPNGLVPHVFAQTNISMPKYLLAFTAGLIPTTLLCTFLGDRLYSGNYGLVIILTAVFLLIAAIVYLLKNRIMGKITQESNSEESE